MDSCVMTTLLSRPEVAEVTAIRWRRENGDHVRCASDIFDDTPARLPKLVDEGVLDTFTAHEPGRVGSESLSVLPAVRTIG